MPAMNLADPELELIDPTPNIHALFLQFDKVFFYTKLNSRAVVRWSKRMYSCAGICSYEGRGGLCDIALSEPLLKLRPRKDLVETLLHEMIHAFLFVTNRDQDRDGHGPNFKSHMHRINQSAGLNITIYHDFHDEVKLYRTHWWRCDGPCQKRSPYFGIVRRTNNRSPGPTDFWWKEHKRKCGGNFVKIKEPEVKNMPIKRRTSKSIITKPKKTITSKGNADILKYVKINNDNINGIKTLSNKNTNSKVNNINTLMTTKPTTPPKPVQVFTGIGNVINSNKTLTNYSSVTEHIRNVWANKQIPTKVPINSKVASTSATKRIPTKVPVNNKVASTSVSNPNKHKAEGNISSTPVKMKKLDDYFKANATLKDLYGDEYQLPKPQFSNKTDATNMAVDAKIIECPVCKAKIDSKDINTHLDECLNKDIIDKLTQEYRQSETGVFSQNNVNNSRQSESGSQKLLNNNVDNNIQNNVRSVNNLRINNNGHTLSNKGHIDLTINNLLDNGGKPNDIRFNDDQIQISNRKTITGRRKTDSQLQSTDKIVDTMRDKNVSDTVKNENNNTQLSDRFITRDRGDKITSEAYIIKVEPEIGNVRSNADLTVAVPSTSKSSDKENLKSDTIVNATNPSPEPGTSQNNQPEEQTCPCCGSKFIKSLEDHLDECLAFVIDKTNDEANTPSEDGVIVIPDDEDDEFDETLTLNSTGTKTPCPCCMKMVEETDMNDHLDLCLGLRKD